MKKLSLNLAFVALTTILWIGSMILSFFGGAIVMAIFGEEESKNIKKRVKPIGTVDYHGLKNESDTKNTKFTMLFDKNSPNWSATYEVNEFFLRTVQSYLNDRLKARGHVFVNDVFVELGMPRNPAGQRYGWLAENETPIELEYSPLKEGAIMLKFDVDGEIWDQI